MAYAFNPITGKLDDVGTPTSFGYTVVAAAVSLKANDRIAADTSAGGFTLTLPASPANGDTISLYDYANTFGVNTLTVARNGSNIESLAENLICNVAGSAFDLIYGGAAVGWHVVPQTSAPLQTKILTLASPVTYTSDTTGSTIFSVSLDIGTYEFEQFVSFSANSSNSKVSVLDTIPGIRISGFRGTYSNPGSPVRIGLTNAFFSNGAPFGPTANAQHHERAGVMYVTIAGVFQITASQNTSSPTPTTVAAGSYIKFRRLD